MTTGHNPFIPQVVRPDTAAKLRACATELRELRELIQPLDAPAGPLLERLGTAGAPAQWHVRRVVHYFYTTTPGAERMHGEALADYVLAPIDVLVSEALASLER